MSHMRLPSNFKKINKKKIVTLVLAIGVILLILCVAAVALVVASISALNGQADTDIGQSISNIFVAIWNYVSSFINALWQQIIANPLQFLTGGSN